MSISDLPWRNETEFYDMHAKDIFSKFPFYHAVMIGNEEEFLQYIIKKARIKKGSRIADLGCGSGYVVGNLNEICDIVGISTSIESIKQCKINYPKCKFEVSNMETFSFDNATHFLSLESLGYANAEKTFDNAYKNLINGGIFYIKTCCSFQNETEQQKLNREHGEWYWKFKCLTVLDIIKIACNTGFKLVEFNDINRNIDIELYKKILKRNKVEYVIPCPNVKFLITAEFVFIK